jgi:AraC-like DNA-binding protein
MDQSFPGLLINFHGQSSVMPYKIGFCQHGNFQLEYRNENFNKTIQAGSNFIITPRPDSRLLTMKNSQISFLYIFISPKFIADYFNISNNELKVNLKNASDNEFIFAQGKNSTQINMVLNDLFRDNYNKNLTKIILESKTLELLSLFFQQFVNTGNAFSSKEKDTILDVQQFIESNLNEPITIKQLSINSGMNEHKLQKSFKIIFGTTIQKHIRKLRMQKARQLILQNNKNVSEAAYLVGYTNLSHFASAFRQEFGILPSEIKLQ